MSASQLGRPAPWLVFGSLGWIGFVLIGWSLYRADPRNLGFDLELLLQAGQDVADGRSPYAATLAAGTIRSATDLFFSYPPPVAQAMALIAGAPTLVVLLGWAAGATLGLAVAASSIARRIGHDPVLTASRVVLAAPLVLPFAVALLFGNFDAWYGLLYGALLIAVLPGAGRPARVGGGIALGVMTIAKLHPAVMLVWLGARAIRDRSGTPIETLLVALCTIAIMGGLSVGIGGTELWADWIAVLQLGAGASVVDPRNLGPVSLLGQATGLDGAALRFAQLAVSGLAVAGVAVAAFRPPSAVSSLSVAAALSLVVLPVTWYHYLVALMPFGIALATWHPTSRPFVLAAVATAGVAIAWLPIAWAAVLLLLVATLLPTPVRLRGGT